METLFSESGVGVVTVEPSEEFEFAQDESSEDFFLGIMACQIEHDRNSSKKGHYCDYNWSYSDSG